MMQKLKYLGAYSSHVQSQVQSIIEKNQLGEIILKKYPAVHEIKTDKALYDYTIEIKNHFLRKSHSLSKVNYDNKINVIHHALGLHTSASRIQGSKLKAKHEIKIATVFKNTPIDFLRMIVVHELAHLKEKEHNKAFYKLCEYMEPQYHQFEFDLRLYMTHLDLFGNLY